MATPRRLLARLRESMAHGSVPLPDLVRLVAGELVSEVCSVYATRPGFRPLAADLVSIDPGSGSATARHERFDASGDAPQAATR